MGTEKLEIFGSLCQVRSWNLSENSSAGSWHRCSLQRRSGGCSQLGLLQDFKYLRSIRFSKAERMLLSRAYPWTFAFSEGPRKPLERFSAMPFESISFFFLTHIFMPGDSSDEPLVKSVPRKAKDFGALDSVSGVFEWNWASRDLKSQSDGLKQPKAYPRHRRSVFQVDRLGNCMPFSGSSSLPDCIVTTQWSQISWLVI